MPDAPASAPVSAQLSRRASRWLLTGLLVLGLFFLWASLMAAQVGLATRGWTAVDGTVAGVAVRRELDRYATATDEASRERQSSFRLELRYRWTVQGRDYVGNRYAIGNGSTVSRHGERAEAEAAARAWKPGATVRVYVDPENPSEAVLQTGPDGVLWIFAGVSGTCVLLVLVVLWRQLRPPRGPAT